MEQKEDKTLEKVNNEFDLRVQILCSTVHVEDEIISGFIKTCREMGDNVSYCTEIKYHHDALLSALEPMKESGVDNDTYQLSLNVMLAGILRFYYQCIKKTLDNTFINKGVKENGQKIDLALEMSVILALLNDLEGKINDNTLKELCKEVEGIPKACVDLVKAKQKASNPGCAAVILAILIPTILSFVIF